MNAGLALPRLRPRTFVASAAVLWFAAYLALAPLADALVAMLPVARESRLVDALRFFLYDTPKVLLLLTGVVMVMGMINSYFTPERTRVLLAGRARMEAHLEDSVQQMPRAHAAVGDDVLTRADRLDAGFASVREIVGKVWPYVIIGVAVVAGGILIVGYVFNAVL